jgi:probable HAF family extracellular repeat protein
MRFTSGAPTAGFTMTFGTQSMTDGQNLSVTVSSGATANVSFDGNTRSSAFNGGAISAWQWTIDSTVVSTAASFSQTLGIGTHNISLIVTDNRAKQSTAALGTVTVSNQGSAGQQYTITDLGSLAGGDTSATAINNNGQVVGWSAVNAGSFFQGFLWTGTAGMVQIGPAPNAQSGYYQPYSLNNTGTAVGRALSLTSGDYASSFDLTHPGSMIAVGTGIPGHANGINNAGQIVGTSFYPNGGFPYAFLWSSSSSLVNLSAQLSLPNNAVSSGDAINNKGQVIINAADPLVWTPGSGIGSTITLSHTSTGVAHAINDFGLVAGTDFPNAVIWNAASNIKTVLGHLPASSFGEALALNNNAVEVGYSGTLSFGSSPQDSSHIATLYSLGTSYDLNSLIPANSGWVLREAVGINDAGQVAGTGVHNGQLRAFLLTPQNPSQVLFSDFGPNDTSSGTGWYEGTGSGTAFLSEMGFTPSGAVGAQFTLDSVEVVVGLVAGTNELDVSILNDNNGLPGATVLESFHFSNAMSPWNNAQHQTLSATSASKPTLVAGTQYWVKVVPTNYSQTVVGWNLTPYDDFGPVYVMGYGLRSDHRGVFRIRGTPR